MIDIEIEGLNHRQQILADMIWACDSRADINRLMDFLPTKELKDEAVVIIDLMLMATIEACVDGQGSMDEAQELINRVSK